LEPLPDFSQVEARVLAFKAGRVFVGREEVTGQLRDILRDQAEYMLTSQLWELFNASLLHEAADMALVQSKDWDHVLAAKMLRHYQHYFQNVIHLLGQK
jgi:hypothetical protein